VTTEVASLCPLHHLVIEQDVARGPEQHVHQHPVLDRLVQPLGLGPARFETGRLQALQCGVGLVGTNEEVDVVGVPWTSRSPGDHPAHEDVGDTLGLDGVDGLAQHPEEHVVVDVALALPDLEVQLGDLLRLRILSHGDIVAHFR